MIKKIDWYILKTFFGPFFFIFSILFFIFIVQLAWIQLDQLVGKGLSNWDVIKFLYYYGITIIQFVLPLTILLSSIMTFGGFGERYELAAIKSCGVSLTRIMAPLFILVCLMAIGLYFFSDRLVPYNQMKAKNMMYNILRTRPALKFTAGQFINELPQFSIKVAEKYGEQGEKLEKVFLHKKANSYEDQQTIIADRGVLVPSQDKHYLKFDLYNGYIYTVDIKGKSFDELNRQPNQTIKFDTLTLNMNISELIDKAIESQTITDYYKFYNYSRINKALDTFRIKKQKEINTIASGLVTNSLNAAIQFEKINPKKKKYSAPFDIKKLDSTNKAILINSGITAANTTIEQLKPLQDQAISLIRDKARMIIYQQRMIMFSVTCIIFFLIGAPLGSIIRKGGVGMPVVVAIVIFVIFYAILTATENMAKTQFFNPYLAAWMPNIVTLPLGIIFTRNALNDSELFNIDNYLYPIQKFFSRFMKKTEHKRYQ